MITLFNNQRAPNGWKTTIVLEALGIPYETKYLSFVSGEQRDPAFTKYNPNARVPAIVDHDNDDFILWESNSIARYLVERYDKDRKLHYPVGSKESYVVDQWLDFQGTAQNATYIRMIPLIRAEKKDMPAIEASRAEIVRQVTILDQALAGKIWLVGDKPTIADYSFVPWNVFLHMLLGESEAAKEVEKLDNFKRWKDALLEQPAVSKALEMRMKVMKEAGLA